MDKKKYKDWFDNAITHLLIISFLCAYCYFIVPNIYYVMFSQDEKVIVTEATINDIISAPVKPKTRQGSFSYKFNYQGKDYYGSLDYWWRYSLSRIMYDRGTPIKFYFYKDKPETNQTIYDLTLYGTFGFIIFISYIQNQIRENSFFFRALRRKKYRDSQSGVNPQA